MVATVVITQAELDRLNAASEQAFTALKQAEADVANAQEAVRNVYADPRASANEALRDHVHAAAAAAAERLETAQAAFFVHQDLYEAAFDQVYPTR